MEVQLKGFVVQVDEQDAHLLYEHRWQVRRLRRTFYVLRSVRTLGRKTTEFLHRRILNVTDSRQVDHRDRDGLNNTRWNLRIATPLQQRANSGGRRSGFKGVSLDARDRRRRPWRARLKMNGVNYDLGCHETELEAARAYDAAAIRFFGEFACTNFGRAMEAQR